MTTFTGTSGDDSILGTSGGDDFHLEQGGEDSASGAAGIDVFYLGATFDAGDRIDGGVDLDYLVLDGDYSAGVVLTATSLTSVETIQLGGGFSYKLTGFTDANLRPGLGVNATIDAHLLQAGDTLTLDFSAVHAGPGGAGVEVLGGAGANDVGAGEGDDTLDGGQGALDILRGGKGDDYIIGSASGVDTLGGGQGNDLITYGEGAALVQGGAGDDVIGLSGVGSSATVDGGDGNDVLSVGVVGDHSSITGGDGDDRISFSGKPSASAVLDGGAGVDTLKVADTTGGTLFLHGAQFRNFDALDIEAGEKVVLDDAMFSKGQTVQVHIQYSTVFDASAEKSAGFVVSAGDQDDSLVGGGGDDNMSAGKGDDVLIGGKGDDTLGGGFGSDKLVGGAGDDLLVGGMAARHEFSLDTVLGGAGADNITIYGGVAKGGAGDDDISGVGSGRLVGGAGADHLSMNGQGVMEGGSGDDVLSGWDNESFVGGAGQDTMTGQGDFVFEKVTDSLVSAPDQIAAAQNSTIFLEAIDADATQAGDQAFHWVDSFTGHGGELTHSYDSFRDLTSVSGDVDGDGQADFMFQINGDLSNVSFVL